MGRNQVQIECQKRRLTATGTAQGMSERIAGATQDQQILVDVKQQKRCKVQGSEVSYGEEIALPGKTADMLPRRRFAQLRGGV